MRSFHFPNLPHLGSLLAKKGFKYSGLEDQYTNVRHPIRHATGGPTLAQVLAGRDPGLSQGVMVGPYFRGATVGRRFQPEMGTPEWPVQGVHFGSRDTAKEFANANLYGKPKLLHEKTLDLRKTADWRDDVDPRVAKNVAKQIRNLANTKKLTAHDKAQLFLLAKQAQRGVLPEGAFGTRPGYDRLRETFMLALGRARLSDYKSWQFDPSNKVYREFGQRFRTAFTKAGYDSVKYREPVGPTGGIPTAQGGTWDDYAIAVLKRPKRTINKPSRIARRGVPYFHRSQFYEALKGDAVRDWEKLNHWDVYGKKVKAKGLKRNIPDWK